MNAKNPGRFFGLSAMGRESDNGLPVTDSAQLAAAAADTVADGRRAYYNFPASRRDAIFPLLNWQYSHHRPQAQGCQFIGMGRRIGAEVDRKPVIIAALNIGRIAPVCRVVMGISKAPAALVGLYQVAQGSAIDQRAITGQVARLVMPPQLALRQCRDFVAKIRECVAPVAAGYRGPVQRKRATARIASLGIIKWAIWRAGRRACGAYGYWPGFSIAGFWG